MTAAAAGLPGALRRPDRPRARRGVPSASSPSPTPGAPTAGPRSGLVHGDYRLDNLLFSADGCTVVDWQTCAWGPAMLDASYFIGGGLSVEDRRAHEEELVRHLPRRAGWPRASRASARDRAGRSTARQAFHGLLMTIAASMVVERTDRGDDMFMAWLARNAQQILDLDALSLLPEPGQQAGAALRPRARGRGPPQARARGAVERELVLRRGQRRWHARASTSRLGRLPNQDVRSTPPPSSGRTGRRSCSSTRPPHCPQPTMTPS